MKGWQRDAGPANMHSFHCDPPTCQSRSVVVYELLAAGQQVTFEQYRQGAVLMTNELQKRNTQGAEIKLLGVEDASRTTGALPLRLFKMRRLVTAPDGAKKYMIGGYLFGSHHTVSITSSAAQEKEADRNFMQYAAPLWLVANNKLERHE